MVVLDTSALLYWTLDPQQLSSAASQAIDNSERLVVSSISIWEIALKVKQGKLTIPLSMTEYVTLLERVKSLQIAAVDVPTWLANVELNWDHRDPADRTVVATAWLLGCPLVASDQRIAAFYDETIW